MSTNNVYIYIYIFFFFIEINILSRAIRLMRKAPYDIEQTGNAQESTKIWI